MTQKVGVLLKAGPRQPGGPRPMAWRPGGPLLIFHSFFVQREIHAHAQICIGFGRAKWTMVSLNSFTILIIISILFDPFFPWILLSEKYCHSLFIRLFIRPFCTPKPDADLCMCVDLPLDKKIWKIRTGPPGHRVARPPGVRATRPLGHGPQAAGPRACF